MDEKKLISDSKNGDIEAFETLVCSQYQKIYNICLKILKDENDAYDASQETFLKAFKYINKFEEKSSFSTWLYRIAYNVCLDEIKKIKKRPNTISIEQEISLSDNDVVIQIEDKKVNVEKSILENEKRKILNEAINTLPEKYREMIILRDVEGFSYEEISKITKINIGTVKSKINRARLALKEILLKNKELFLAFIVLIIKKGG